MPKRCVFVELRFLVSKILLSDLKAYLIAKKPVELVGEILELFKLFSSVKEYYGKKLNPAAESDLLTKYKDILANEFTIGSRGQVKLRFSVIRKAISEFQKLSPTPENLAELMMHVVEKGVAFTNEFGDFNEAFYDSIASMYRKVIQHILANHIQAKFQGRCKYAMEACHDIGWGFGDEMEEIYQDNFS